MKTDNRLQPSLDTLPANAWGEWTRIDMPLNAWKDMVRPVVFRERLHVIWVEREEIARTESGGQVSMHERFTLKLAFRRHDGNWSAPWSHDVSAQIASIPAGTTPLGLNASGFAGEDTLLVFVYRLAERYADFGENNNLVTGLTVHGDGVFRALSKNQLRRYSVLSNTFSTHIPATGTTINKANYRFAVGYDFPSSLALTLKGDPSDFISISTAKINNITCHARGDDLTINIGEGLIEQNYNLLAPNMSRIMDAIGISGKSEGYIVFKDQMKETFTYGYNGPFIAYNKSNGFVGVNLSSGILSPNDRISFQSSVVPITHSVNLSNQGTHLRLNMREGWFRGLRSCAYITSRGIEINRISYSTPIDTDEAFLLENAYLIIGGTSFKYDSTDKQDNRTNFKNMQVDILNPFENSNETFVSVSAVISNNELSKNSSARGTLHIRRVDFTPENIIKLYSTDTGAQYFQLGVHRIRLNTLLGPQLVSLAAAGIDAILSMNTQHLPEPKLGKGFYATFTLPAYNAAEHGTNRNFRLHLKHVVDNNAHVIYSGQFQDQELTVRSFIPLDVTPLQRDYVAKVFLTTQKNPNDGTWNGPHFTEINGVLGIHASSITSMFSNVSILSDTTEPMDFNGACALYFWELFYYTPMMAFQRLLQEQNFSEATRWLNYVWNPITLQALAVITKLETAL